MRVAYVVTEYVTEDNFSGGLASYTYRIAKSMLKIGHIPEVFVSTNRNERIVHDGILVHRTKTKSIFWLNCFQMIQRIFMLNYFKNIPHVLAMIISLKERLNHRHLEAPFDIVHYTHLQGTGLFRLEIPSVVRLSSYPPLWIPYGFQFTSRFQRLIENMAIKRADTVISPSYFVADYVRKKMKKPVHVVESPFVPIVDKYDDASIFNEMRNDQSLPKKYGLYFGSLAEWKGIYVIVDALMKLLKEFPYLGFVFIGRDLSYKNGMPASRFILKKLSLFKNRVFVITPLMHPKLYPFIRKALFVTLPSLADNFPNTCLESMWMRKVVIGTRGRSFDQLITHRENGFLCEPGSSASLLSCMREAISLNKDEREVIGNLAHKRIEMLSPEKIGHQLEKIYRDISRT